MSSSQEVFAKKVFRVRLNTFGFSSYNAYLKSPHWQRIGEEMAASILPKVCVFCGSTQQLQIHHRTYERIGREILFDLIPLCGECHILTHVLSEEQGIPLLHMGKIMDSMTGHRNSAARKRLKLMTLSSLRIVPKTSRDLRMMYEKIGHEAFVMQHKRLFADAPLPELKKGFSTLANSNYCNVLAGPQRANVDKSLEKYKFIRNRELVWQQYIKDNEVTAPASHVVPLPSTNDQQSPTEELVLFTEKILQQGISVNGSWSNRQFAALGVPVPLQSGWRQRLIGRLIQKSAVDKFLSMKNKHVKKSTLRKLMPAD